MGFAAEAQAKAFLSYHKNTFAKAEYPCEKDILELASRYHRAKLNTLREFHTLSELGSHRLMDLIFKCDVLVEYDSINGDLIKVSIDVTSNLQEVYKKKEEILSKRKSLKRLGVDRALVLVWQVEAFAKLTTAQSYDLATKILDRLDSNEAFVNTVVLTDADFE